MITFFGFELSVLESVNSRKNISVPRHAKYHENRFLGTFRGHRKQAIREFVRLMALLS
jgi:hypothetical protein